MIQSFKDRLVPLLISIDGPIFTVTTIYYSDSSAEMPLSLVLVFLLAPIVLLLFGLPTVSYLLYFCKHSYIMVRKAILWPLLLLILLFPIILFAFKQKTEVAPTSELYRREWVTMVSLDVAISHHFYLIAGYTLTAIVLAFSWSLIDGQFINYLLAFVSLGPHSDTLLNQILVLLMGSYGFIGIALLVSLTMSTYSRVNNSFSQSSKELEELVASLLPMEADEISWKEMDQERRNTLMRVLAGEMLQQAIDRGDFGNPTLTIVWRRLRGI